MEQKMYLRPQVREKAALIIHTLKDTRKAIRERLSYSDPNPVGVCTFFNSRINTKEINGKVSFISLDDEQIIGIFTIIHMYKNKDIP